MESIILTNVSLDELADRIAEKLALSGKELFKQPEEKEQNEYLSIKEASELLHLAVPTIYGLTHNYAIPHLKKGHKLWFKRSELLAWIDSGRRLTKKETEEEVMLSIRSIHQGHKSFSKIRE